MNIYAVSDKVLAVGATDGSDNIADFSSRGPVVDEEVIKPDIVAPGVAINSTHLSGGYEVLGGTTVAKPHVAGAAALIKQLHPTWTPEMIKANLMNTSKDLGANVYTQGAGRLQVNQAAIAQAVFTPASVGFGLVDPTQPLWIESAMLQLTNISTTSLGYSLYVSGTLPTGVTRCLDRVSATLAVGDSITVTLHITVDNAIAPQRNEEPFSYQGQVIATTVGQALQVPFSFRSGPTLSIIFDQSPLCVFLHDGEMRRAVRHYPGEVLSLLLPEGIYDAWLMYHNPFAYVIREGVVVTSAASINIGRSDARHTITSAFRDKSGQVISETVRGTLLIRYRDSQSLYTYHGPTIPLQ